MSKIADVGVQATYEVLPRCNSVHQGKWYALQTVPRHEKKVALQLKLDDLEVFVPTFPSENTWSDRTKKVDLPIFPGYAFLQSSEIHHDKKFLYRNRSVIRILADGAGPAEIPADEMRKVLRAAQSGNKVSCVPYLTVGQKIRIRNGALRGLEGVLMRIAKEDSLVLSVDLIQRSISICIQGYEVEQI